MHKFGYRYVHNDNFAKRCADVVSCVRAPDQFGRVFSGPTKTVAVELRDAP